jgi:predicted RNA-binding protein YlxR (DUF448 family)
MLAMEPNHLVEVVIRVVKSQEQAGLTTVDVDTAQELKGRGVR